MLKRKNLKVSHGKPIKGKRKKEYTEFRKLLKSLGSFAHNELNKNSIRNQKGDFTSAQTGKTDTP